MFGYDYAQLLGLPAWLLVIVLAWSLAWKGFALWKSARRNQAVWFVVLLVVNTIGILEILYLFLFSKINLSDTSSKRKKARKKKN